ncbi:MAG: Inosose dehydratase [Gemmatimonadaceae bacterium]|nr:Inosose dehydratase [Gemmatimonadaceae bacterium]
MALTAGVSARSPVDPIPATARRLKRIGLQLYSVRAEMQRDPERTMAAVAGIGYRDVELLWSFGNFGRTVAQVRAALDNTGLSAPSAHMSAATILVGWERSLDIARTLGHSYLIVPSLPGETAGTLDDWREWADRFNAAGARAREAGIWLAFHNEPEHVRQVDGGTPLDVFIERTAPDVVRLQLDIGNMAMGGGDPIRYLERYPDRFWSFHIKDVVADGSRDTGLGMGRLPIARFLAGVSDLDAKPCFVEQEGATDPLASAAEDFAYLRNLEF